MHMFQQTALKHAECVVKEAVGMCECERERERERKRERVHSASLAYEDGIVFMSEPSVARQ